MMIYDLSQLSAVGPGELLPATVPALGNFDGVHLGHASLFQEAVKLAKKRGAYPAVWTFTRHPFENDLRILSDWQEKMLMFAEAGIRYLFLCDPEAVWDLDPETFVNQVLVGSCHAAGAVCGYNFRFGRGGAGDSELLTKLFQSSRGEVSVVPLLRSGEEIICSTRVRELLQVGDVELAARYLGHSFSVRLPVLNGKKLGRAIGVPTVNQEIPWLHAVPANGTYATAVPVGDKVYPAVTNIGTRPTIQSGDDHVQNSETHIIGYSGDLYHTSVRVLYRFRLRNEQRFPNLDSLVAQIHMDIERSSEEFIEDDYRVYLREDDYSVISDIISERRGS